MLHISPNVCYLTPFHVNYSNEQQSKARSRKMWSYSKALHWLQCLEWYTSTVTKHIWMVQCLPYQHPRRGIAEILSLWMYRNTSLCDMTGSVIHGSMRRRGINCQDIDKICIQYIPRNMHTVFALLCFVVVIHWLIFPNPSGLRHWHCGNLTIALVPAKQPWWIWINTCCEFIMNDCITTTKQSTTKPCACFLVYTVDKLNESLSSTRKNTNWLSGFSVNKWDRMQLFYWHSSVRCIFLIYGEGHSIAHSGFFEL